MKCSQVKIILPNHIIDNINSLSKSLDIESRAELVSRAIVQLNTMYKTLKKGDRIVIERRNGTTAEFTLG